MARLFISHSSADNAAARALGDWLVEQGYDDTFLDIDPERGLVAGQKWQEALKAAADRCEAVLFLVSPAWLNSRWCLAEFLLAKSLHKRIFGLIVDPVPLDQVPAEMTAEWQLCELVGEDRLRTFEVELLGRRAQVAFREGGLDLLRRGLERAGLDARSFPWPPRDEPSRAPYRGLKALEPQDAAIFFGRDAWIVRGLDRIRGLAERGVDRMLVILGASGSGKSSFLRAGLWPRLLRDDLNFLPLPIVRPQTAVMTGSTGLATALAGAFTRLGKPRSPGRLRETLGEDATGFGKLIDELSTLAKRRHVALAEPPGDPVVVLPLDQAEELFNPEGSVETAVFIDLLAGLTAEGAGSSRLFVVATMRSDRFELLQNEPRLQPVKRDLFDLPPIPPSEFKTVIEGPARRVAEAGGRLVIDPALTERLIVDADGADALPLLGFTLERLYADYGAEGRLTLAEYERLGGVQGSIEAAVAAALAESGRVPEIPADREAQFAALRGAFIPWLARIDPESGAPMRRVACRDEIPRRSHAIVDRLVEARLLVADRRDRADVVEIAHESLLRQWPALTAWLDADAADLALVEGVERAAAEWQRNNRLNAWLDHRGDRLAAAMEVRQREDFHRRFGAVETEYLEACRTREARERGSRRRAKLIARAGIVLSGILALGLGYWTWESTAFSASHRFFASDCTTCHKQLLARVPDAACLGCHGGISNHIEPAADVGPFRTEIASTRCTHCHSEHNGVRGAILHQTSLCLDCHLSVAQKAPGAGMQDVGGFPQGHPEFRVSLVADAAEMKLNRVKLGSSAALVNRSGLKFSHAAHLNIPPEFARQVKGCADCHVAEPGGLGFREITYHSTMRALP